VGEPVRHGIPALLLAGLVVASICSWSIGGEPSRASASTSTPSGCGSNSPGSTTLSPSIDGFTRTVVVHVPAGYSDTTHYPLVLNLHGSGATALDQEGFTNMDATADKRGFIVAYPQALITDGTGFDWNVPGVALVGGRKVPAHAANDVKFLTALVPLLEKKYCIDPLRVYATGFSGGAREVSQLACDDSTLFAAVAPVSGLRHPTPCPTQRAVPVITFHGSADPVDPFDGHGQAYWTYSVSSAAKDWARQDKCAGTPAISKSMQGVVETTYSKCLSGAEVELYEVIGEGHEWPGGPTMPAVLTSVLGPQSSAVKANRLMWSFFEAHPLP
jgi:polyhydroxybutyrate depolymerase